MSIEILERGVLPETKVSEIRCENCNSLLRFSKGDLDSGTQYNQTYYYLTCPVCSKTISINMSKTTFFNKETHYPNGESIAEAYYKK